MLKTHYPRNMRTHIAFAWLLFFSLLITYWLRLDASNQSVLADAERDTRLRAGQTAHALSKQINTQLQGIDFFLEHLAEHWLDHDLSVFKKLISLAQKNIFNNSLDAVIVANADGQIVFNSRVLGHEPITTLSIAHRDYFQQHSQHKQQSLLISRPIKNTLTQRWTVQFSYPLLVEGEFAGIILATVPVKYLAQALGKVYPDQDDVVLVTLDNGQYLVRTHALEDSLNTTVPAQRDFIQHPEQVSGHYSVTAPIDGVERFYAWHRITDFPLILSLGLGKEKALAPTFTAIKKSQQRTLLSFTLLFAAALWISRLFINRAKQNQSLVQAQERLSTLLNRVPSGVLLEDEHNRIVTINSLFCTLLKLDAEPSTFIGMHHGQLLSKLPPEKAAWLPMPRNKLNQRYCREYQDSNQRTLEFDWVPIQRDYRYLGHVWFVQDITTRKQYEQELHTLASTDPLTGLLNRRSFMDILRQQLSLSTPHWPGALLLLDIDHFKQVNDTYGHPAGDDVLRNVAQVMRHSLRQDDYTGRLGGEEFAILLPKATQQQALELAERVRQHISATPTTTSAGTIHITISIGVTLLHQQSKQSVQEHADRALYQAKNTGRNRVCCSTQVPAQV